MQRFPTHTGAAGCRRRPDCEPGRRGQLIRRPARPLRRRFVPGSGAASSRVTRLALRSSGAAVGLRAGRGPGPLPGGAGQRPGRRRRPRAVRLGRDRAVHVRPVSGQVLPRGGAAPADHGQFRRRARHRAERLLRGRDPGGGGQPGGVGRTAQPGRRPGRRRAASLCPAWWNCRAGWPPQVPGSPRGPSGTPRPAATSARSSWPAGWSVSMGSPGRPAPHRHRRRTGRSLPGREPCRWPAPFSPPATPRS